MLVLTRKCGQNLIINDNITVRILEIRGGQVKLGIVAPQNVSVRREEVYLAIKEANLQAAVTGKKLPELSLSVDTE